MFTSGVICFKIRIELYRVGGQSLSTDIILGVDIYPHYLTNTKSRRFALAVLEGDRITAQYKQISRIQLIRLITRYKPHSIAFDNIHEVAASISGLRSFVARLPEYARIIQVTDQNTKNLQRLAAEQGLSPPSKINPLEEAIMTARLAQRGIGFEVHIFENETKIIVSRNVSLGPGGSSQNRYRRKIHTSIRYIAKEIEAYLQKNSLDHDLFSREADFGLDRAHFHIYAPRNRLSHLKLKSGKHVQVKIKPIFRREISLHPIRTPLIEKPRYTKQLFIGVDPGTNCGVAIITTNSKPLLLTSRKQLTRGQITRMIMEYGFPLVIASDKKPVPEFVRKLANMIDGVLFTPDSLMEVSEKRALSRIYAEKWGIKIKNSHIRDALAAAIKALNHYQHKFSQIEHEAQKNGRDIPIDEIRASVIKGTPIHRAIQQVKAKQTKSNEPLIYEERKSEKSDKRHDISTTQLKKFEKKINFYKKQNQQLQASNKMLIENSVKLKKRIKNLTDALEYEKQKTSEAIATDREFQQIRSEILRLHHQVAQKQKQIRILEEELEIIQAFKKLEAKGDVILLKPIETFTREGIEKAAQLYSLQQKDAVILLDASGGGTSTAKELLKHGIETVVTVTAMSHQAEETFEKFEVPVLSSLDLEVEWISGYPYARSNKLSTAIQGNIKTKTEETGLNLAQIVSQYQSQRTKDT
jgi:predicted RNase H-like nuclease (RuvC/YqgF family)